MKSLILIVSIVASVLFADIFESVRLSNFSEIDSLVKKDITILESKNERGLTPLNFSASLGDFGTFKYLLDLGADIKTLDREKSSVLINAVASGNSELVRYIISKGCDIDYQDENKMTALHFAAINENPEICRILLDSKPKILKNINGSSPLISSAFRGWLENVKLLLDYGCDVNEQNIQGLNVAYFAVMSKNLDLLKYLYEKKADFKLKDRQGNNILKLAFQRSNLECVEYLIDLGIDIQEDKDENFTIINAALRSRNPALIKKVFDLNVSMSKEAKNNLVPDLFGLDEENFTYVFDKLFKDDVSCFSGCNQNEIPLLFWTVFLDKPEYLKFIIKNGVSLDVVSNITNKNILHEAITDNKFDIVELVLDKISDINNVEKYYSKSILHSAVLSGRKDIVEKILNVNSVNVNPKDNMGYTPLDYASKYGFKSIEEILLNRGGIFSEEYNLIRDIQKITGNLKITHTGHSGFIVNDNKTAIIFDYWENGRQVDDRSLKNGNIVFEELKGMDIFVFVSHVHEDHYDKKIFEYFGDKATYILGFEDNSAPKNTIVIPGRTERKVGDLTVNTIYSNDTGVGFVVDYNGVKIFHSGDHANRRRDFSGNYLGEINYIKDKVGSVDIFITPVSGCSFGDKIAVWMGGAETVSILNPKLVIPAHANNTSMEFSKFAEYIRLKNNNVQVQVLNNPGDWILF
ncbi:MAG: ankyrin repeat domain-containing protein [Candidatus Delongbacteria bacterium]|nr:ankyrin repeat domain-containing protein [Candidatus Delongbacteria bacterium]MBN2836508.1 ankyrin repeat domain-containing protein [Candidatus Delongbacteria bacterium]